MICKNCGSQYDDGAECQSCESGAGQLDVPADVPADVPQQQHEVLAAFVPQKKPSLFITSSNYRLIALISVAACVIGHLLLQYPKIPYLKANYPAVLEGGGSIGAVLMNLTSGFAGPLFILMAASAALGLVLVLRKNLSSHKILFGLLAVSQILFVLLNLYMLIEFLSANGSVTNQQLKQAVTDGNFIVSISVNLLLSAGSAAVAVLGFLKNKGTHMSYQRRRSLSYWVMLIPFLAGFFIVFLGIYGNSLQYSFQEIRMNHDVGGGVEQTGVGFDNYVRILTIDPDYRINLGASVSEMTLFTLFITIFSLFIAVILNRKMRGRAFFRAMFFIPVILATGFVAQADTYSTFFDSVQAGMDEANTSGAASMFTTWDLRQLMRQMQFSPVMGDYVLTAVNSIVDIINRSGVQILIFLAGMQSISPAIYESANIDGATGWESFWLITFPMISPLILVNVVYTIIDSLTMPTNRIMEQIDITRKMDGFMGVASAMAWFYFVVVLFCLAIITGILSGYVYYQQKD
jgi:ABC-type sugar transport system permease subunit